MNSIQILPVEILRSINMEQARSVDQIKSSNSPNMNPGIGSKQNINVRMAAACRRMKRAHHAPGYFEPLCRFGLPVPKHQ